MKNLFEHFEILEDPRDIRGKKHELIDILILTIYGILCGYTDFTNMADFLLLNEEYFTDLLDLKNGIPSHDCFSRVFSIIDSKEFMKLFIDWIKNIVNEKSGRFLSIDGKAIKSATDKINGGNTPYIVSGFLSEIGISIGQVKVNDKSNEITAIPELLDLIDISGLIVTIDAIGTQTNIANKIIEKNGNYILKVKTNHRDLMNDIKTYFDIEIPDENSEIDFIDTNFENDHGRIERREYYISYNTSFINNKNKWKNLSAVGMMRCYREENNKVTIKDHYYIISKKLNIETFRDATRSHWNIECQLHWKLDVILDEDHSKNKKGNSIENLAIVRKIVFNLARLDKSMGERLTLNQKITRYNHDFKNIENLIFHVIPSL
jgi:predicted transposase YbfD/YdcC